MHSKQILHITSLNSSGEGVGSLNGLKVFVDGALPEEKVEIEIIEQKKNYAKAKLISILTPSIHRTLPQCPLFGKCGGCQVMHLQYPAQLHFKTQRVIDALKHIGHIHQPHTLPCLPSPLSLGYRNKIQLPIIWDQGQKTLGLYQKRSHEIIPLERCMIQCPQGEEILSLIQKRLAIPSVRYVLIRNAVFNDEALVIFVTNGRFSKELKLFAEELMASNSLIKGVVENLNTRNDNVILGPTFRLLAGQPYIYETLLGKVFKISPSAFFQVNSAQTEKLYETAMALANIQSHETVLDAYCGVGTLALFAADHAQHVYGIECISPAIADAKENARLNGITNSSFICGKAEEALENLDHMDVVFLNPPRKGCDPKLIRKLNKKLPSKLLYISCDPATLARDLKAFLPHYTIQTIQPFDMFPQTMHVETLAYLTLKS